MSNWKDVPLPARMAALPRDPRGYPIPAFAYVDGTGTAHFDVMDTPKVTQLAQADCCPICAGRLGPDKWLVGGPVSAHHERGVYVDPPMHRECAEYALQVCPFLAAPKYLRYREEHSLSEQQAQADGVMRVRDERVAPERPPILVLAMTGSVRIEMRQPSPVFRPERPWIVVAYWRHGRRIGEAEAARLSEWVQSAASGTSTGSP